MATATKKSKTKSGGKAPAAKKGKGITSFGGNHFAPEYGTILYAFDVGREIIVLRINEWKGKKSLVIGKFYPKDDQWLPARGASIPASDAKEFLAGIAEHGKEALKLLGVA